MLGLLRSKKIRRFIFIIIATGIISFSPAVNRQVKADTLDIRPSAQLTHVWCWLAVGEMVFRHFDIPTVNPAGIYQCGIIGALAHGTNYHACSVNCSFCTIPAGSSQGMIQMLEDYPKKVRQYTGSENADVKVSHLNRALSPSEIVDEIDNDRPIVTGISPGNRPAGPNFGSQHVALIVGYENNGQILIVNDPFPFNQTPWNNPYLAAGGTERIPLQYAISHQSFRQNLNWGESFKVRRMAARRDDQSFPNFCCSAFGKLGPYPNYSIPPGGFCQGFHPNFGIVYGQACY